MIVKDIEIPIYHATIMLVITDDLPSVMREYSDEDCTHDIAITVHFETPLKYVVGFDANKLCHMVISHEVVHLTHRILNDTGMAPSFLTDETEAYLHGYIINKIYKVIKKNKLICYGNKD